MELNFWDTNGDSNSGPVPNVETADLRAVWALFRELERSSGEQFAIGVGAFERVCSPGADVRSVWYRAAMLQIMSGRMGLLTRWLHDGQFDDPVFRVAAKFPMGNMPAGVVRQGLPFDVEEFLRQIENETKK